MMKKIIYSIIASSMLFATPSCAELDLRSPDQITVASYFQNVQEAEASLSASYSKLDMGYHSTSWDHAEVKFPFEEYRTDLVYPGLDGANYINWTQIHNFTTNNGNTQVAIMWQGMYIGILRANQTLTGVGGMSADKITDADKKLILAEARFLRAYYHYYLLMNWEKIIIRDELPSADAGNLHLGLSPREETWNFIISEMELAAKDLPSGQQTAAHMGRVTNSAAYAYIGHALVNRAYESTSTLLNFDGTVQTPAHLTNALAALKKVTGHSLTSIDSYAGMFDGSAENGPESILERQFSLTSQGGAWHGSRMTGWLIPIPFGGYDEVMPSQRYYDILTSERDSDGDYDKRAYAAIFFSCDYWNTPGNITFLGDDQTFDEIFHAEERTPTAFIRKYMATTQNEISNSGVNTVLMRYSNVMMLMAECEAQLGNNGAALTIVNNLRAERGMPATASTDAMVAIEHERVMEFGFENSRFFDLRRWGKLTDAGRFEASRKFSKANHFYVIPATETNTNDAFNK